MNPTIEVNEVLSAMTQMYDESYRLSDEKDASAIRTTLNMLARLLKIKYEYDSLCGFDFPSERLIRIKVLGE